MTASFRDIEIGLDQMRANLSRADAAWYGDREQDALDLVRGLAEDANTLARQVEAIRDELGRFAKH